MSAQCDFLGGIHHTLVLRSSFPLPDTIAYTTFECSRNSDVGRFFIIFFFPENRGKFGRRTIETCVWKKKKKKHMYIKITKRTTKSCFFPLKCILLLLFSFSALRALNIFFVNTEFGTNDYHCSVSSTTTKFAGNFEYHLSRSYRIYPYLRKSH